LPISLARPEIRGIFRLDDGVHPCALKPRGTSGTCL